MSDHDCLLAAIVASPDDLVPRLVLADWLADRGIDGSAWRDGTPFPPDWLPKRAGAEDGFGDGGGGDGHFGGKGAGGGEIAGFGGDYGVGPDDANYALGGGHRGHGYYEGRGDGHGGFPAPSRLRPPILRERIMPAIGDAVLVMSEGNHAPYAWVGRVVHMHGPRDWVLDEASLIPFCGSGCTWAGLAQNKGDMRTRMRVRVESGPVEVYGVQCSRRWVGDLPTADQN